MLQEGLSLLVILGARDDCDIHTTTVVDGIGIDLVEHGLFGQTEVVVSIAVELVAADAAEIADAGQGQGQKTIQELPPAVAA